MLTALDGAISEGEDKFRIKIWNKSSEEVIYDNQLGDSDDTNANQTLGGGSIIIHS